MTHIDTVTAEQMASLNRSLVQITSGHLAADRNAQELVELSLRAAYREGRLQHIREQLEATQRAIRGRVVCDGCGGIVSADDVNPQHGCHCYTCNREINDEITEGKSSDAHDAALVWR